MKSLCCPTARTLLAVLIFAAFHLAWCKDGIQDQLNSEYKNKTFLLRNFYAGSDLTYNQSGNLRTVTNEGPWTLAEVRIKGVKLSDRSLEISGERLGVFYEGGEMKMLKTDGIKLHVLGFDQATATRDAVTAVMQKIFLDPAQEKMGDLVPDFWKPYFAKSDSHAPLNSTVPSPKAQPVPVAPGTLEHHSVKPPRVIQAPDPAYTPEATEHGIKGVSVLTLVVDASGNPTDIAIVRPIGMGLDEQAVAAVSTWRFQPATRDDTPVSVKINVETTFHY